MIPKLRFKAVTAVTKLAVAKGILDLVTKCVLQDIKGTVRIRSHIIEQSSTNCI